VGEPLRDGVPTPEEGAALVRLAVETVAARLRGEEPEPELAEFERLRDPGASFVTLERNGRLRGCIGTLDARRPLYLDVVCNALRAMADPRLPPVTVADWPELEVKVAVLTQPAPLATTGLDALVAALLPGVDGLLLMEGTRRSTFLPAVWAKLPEPDRFVEALLTKGGWPAWSDGIRAFRYASIDFADRSPREPLG
jgi:AmmeMemoRadiSam system protein A